MTKDRLKSLDKVRGVLFDLDGTLLQVEMMDFIPAYIERLAVHFADVARHHDFARVMRATTFALISGADGTITNEEFFCSTMEAELGIEGGLFSRRLRCFCADGLASLSPLIRPLPLARGILRRCFERGLKVAIATNPVFPRPLVEARLQWGEIADFPYDLVTSFENSRYCKPHPGYFLQVLEHLCLAPEEVVMIGNDTEHDLGARAAGIASFLVDTWLVDRLDGDFQADFRGNHLDLFRFIGRLGETRPPV
jgi:FMN phosphatase YigB (HAD superfamily)